MGNQVTNLKDCCNKRAKGGEEGFETKDKVGSGRKPPMHQSTIQNKLMKGKDTVAYHTGALTGQVEDHIEDLQSRTVSGYDATGNMLRQGGDAVMDGSNQVVGGARKGGDMVMDGGNQVVGGMKDGGNSAMNHGG